MRRNGRRLRRSLGSLAAALPIVTGLPPPVAGSESIELPGSTIAAVVADLDGDGVREVVRLVRDFEDEAGFRVDIWRHGSGVWEPAAATELGPSPDEGSSAAASLLLARVDGRDRVIALTAEGIPGDEFGGVCCLSLTEVRQVAGQVALTPVAVHGLDRGASVLQAVDLDGDDTDELVTTRIVQNSTGTEQETHIEVLGWRDGDLVEVGEVDLAEAVSGMVEGETDGHPGSELLHGLTPRGSMYRLALVQGELVREEAEFGTDASADEPFPEGWITGLAGELIILTEQRGLRTLRWPSEGQPQEVHRVELPGEYPWVNVVGHGLDAILVHLGGSPFGNQESDATILDLRLRRIGEVALSPTVQAAWRFLEQGIEAPMTEPLPYPYVGPFPAELGGSGPAFAGGGMLIAQDVEGGYQARAISALAGLSPHGTAGLDDAFLVVSTGLWYGWSDAVYLSPTPVEATLAGGLMLMPVDDLWEPQQSSRASVDLVSAEFAPDGEHLLSGPDGFAAMLSAPPGTRVVTSGRRPEILEVGGEVPLRVMFTHPSGDGETNSEFEYGLMAVLPDGDVVIHEWEGTVLREKPTVEATGTTRNFELGARITGQVSPYTDVVVDGAQAEVAEDGSFTASVDAPPWPVDVAVTARDPLGNEASTSVQVIGFVDYRGLPWLPIVGLVTALVGAYALLRLPRRRAATAPAWSDGGTLEEIEIE